MSSRVVPRPRVARAASARRRPSSSTAVVARVAGVAVVAVVVRSRALDRRRVVRRSSLNLARGFAAPRVRVRAIGVTSTLSRRAAETCAR